jgi:hypothetical protein
MFHAREPADILFHRNTLVGVNSPAIIAIRSSRRHSFMAWKFVNIWYIETVILLNVGKEIK